MLITIWSPGVARRGLNGHIFVNENEIQPKCTFPVACNYYMHNYIISTLV